MDEQLESLMTLAGVAEKNRDARRWLRRALEATAPFSGEVHAPIPSDRNAPLDELIKCADALLGQLSKLQNHPHANSAFWHSPFFAVDEEDEPVEGVVRRTVEKIALAAAQARVEKTGRPSNQPKQQAVNLAAAFYDRYAPEKITGTPTSKFAEFARAFYALACGDDTVGLDRQIRNAARTVTERKSPVLS